DEFYEQWSPEDDYGLDTDPYDRQIEPEQPPELITLTLLKKAIATQNPDDEIMQDFGEYVLPNLLRVAIGSTAKGGKYFERKEREYLDRQLREGRETIKQISRRSADDQSLNTHLLNGLFPANAIEQRLEELDTTIQRLIKPKPQRRRFAIAGFILHDFEKFDYDRFPSLPEKYKEVDKDNIRKLDISSHREIISVIIEELGLDRFIDPDNLETYKEHIDDLLYIAYNAEVKEGANLNTSEYGLDRLNLSGRLLTQLADLARIADLLASIIKHPQDADNSSLRGVLHRLSDGYLELTYHSIAENHGVLTNVINNAVMDEFTSLNTPEFQYYQPLLYLSTGVIYLKLKDAPKVTKENLSDRTINKIQELCANELQTRQKGFVREGKGMKYAEYYDLFFNDIELMKIALEAAQNSIRNSKAEDRSNSLVAFQSKKVLSEKYDFIFKSDLRIDRLAEFGDLVTRKIWGSRIEKIKFWAKQNKQKVNLGELESGSYLVNKIAEYWELKQYLPQIGEIQNINEKIKELKLKNTGGLPLEWYYLAAQYIKHHPGCEDIQEAGKQLIECVEPIITPILKQYQTDEDGWEDLRDWVNRVVMLPDSQVGQTDKFLEELNRYNSAKQQRRGKQLICSITHSAYTVKEQMESAVLFTPQVYTNKQMLGGSNAKRNISSIAAIELMLRQILMSETQEVGKKFEDGKYRYLYLYPTYYFTPETNRFLHEAYDRIQQTRFDTGLRNHFISKQLQANFSLNRYQTAGLFQLQTNEEKKGKIFRLNYSEKQPMTFYFMALPPEKHGKSDPTDTESWVMPTWLAFAFPMILDVKTVVSESPIPPFIDGSEFEQTVFLDSAPQAFRMLTQESHFRLDYILEGWENNGKKYSAPLNVLTAAYAIHLDVNANLPKNPNWGRLTD
ncbi:MAG: type I-D CRISPR-associated protein Cas10d/Csc3, partial [Xenococcaceae cyanobacterium]